MLPKIDAARWRVAGDLRAEHTKRQRDTSGPVDLVVVQRLPGLAFMLHADELHVCVDAAIRPANGLKGEVLFLRACLIDREYPRGPAGTIEDSIHSRFRPLCGVLDLALD